MKKENKKVYIEILRIVAIFFVVFNHTYGFGLYSVQKLDSPQYWCYSMVSVLTKVAVPIFLMVSGSMLLEKEESISYLYKKRILKIFLSFLFISLFYYFHNGIVYHIPMSVQDFLQKIYIGKINGHLWYIYLFLGYLIGLPLLRKFVKQMDTKHFIYMFCVAFFFMSILPTIEFFMDRKYSLNGNIIVSWIAGNMVIYPCLGYFMEHKVSTNDIKKYLPIFWIVNVIFMFLTCYMTRECIKIWGQGSAQTYLNTFVNISAVTIYITFKVLFESMKCKPILSKMICSVGSCTYGIYLFHIAVKDRNFMKEFINIMIAKEWNYMISYMIFTLAVVIVSYGFVWVLKKIPGINKII